MGKPSSEPSRASRVLVTLGDELESLRVEAKRKGLRLSTYLRALVITHPERAGGASKR